ncbi:MAG TPA: hypothetical protein ENN23_08760 [Deltaproteobacteria bacterium]|nr:hypothetical protein [Deltaproteobacteria bacterium]
MNARRIKMETEKRIVYLDNLRNIIIYNVVVYHAFLAFAYPLLFWWATVDKDGSARIYETAIRTMYVYMMPCVIFIAALFILPSLQRSGALAYIKKRFTRLYVPVIVFLFCAGDIFPYLLSKRIGNLSLTYPDTFIAFWRSFANIPLIYFSDADKIMNTIGFNFYHTWFLTLLFFLTLIFVLARLPFAKKAAKPVSLDSRNKIILKTILFAVTLSLVYFAVAWWYVVHDIQLNGWTLLGKAVIFENIQIWVLVPLFAFGLYAYKKEWLTRGDIGSWKIWGMLTLIFLGLYIYLMHFIYLPEVEGMYKIVEHNTLFEDKLEMPVIGDYLARVIIPIWLLVPLACVFILMFLLSFAKKFFNKPNAVTAFCSKHSINVYILHYIPILIFQYTFLNVPVSPVLKIVVMIIIIAPACLWLSHRLVYPHPKTAILFFVTLKLIALAAGFEFYYWALLAIIFISFTGAVFEFTKFMASRKKAKC